jgi:phosphomannomutase
MAFDPAIFKAYDIRGIYPTQLDANIARAIGQAFVQEVGPKTVAVGHDVRASGPELYNALIEGLVSAGANVIKIGGISTEQLYFAVAHFGYDSGIAVTASHNPGEYNGFKMVRKGGEPISGNSGLMAIRDRVEALIANPITASTLGEVSELDVFPAYKEFILSFIDVSKLQPMTVVTNANFGYQGKFAERVLEGLPITLSQLNGEPDGTFPKGRPDPFVPENREEFVAKIKAEQPTFGVAWDADADRAFFATGDGVFLEAYYMNAILAQAMLAKQPGQKVVYDVRYTWAVIDAVKAAGGESIPCRVGSSFIKQSLRKHNALFCGESSGHYYFRDYFFCDTGMLPFLLILELLSTTGKTLAELAKPFVRQYVVSGEINRTVADSAPIIEQLKAKYSDATVIDETDRLTIEYSRDWRFNIRTSNTEPLLRLNVEAKSQELMAEKRDELLALIGGQA